MTAIATRVPYICARCLQRQLPWQDGLRHSARIFHTTQSTTGTTSPAIQSAETPEDLRETVDTPMKNEPGAMSRRLQDLSEQGIVDSGTSASNTVNDAGFSEELKQRLEARIQTGRFRSENPQASFIIDMPVSSTSVEAIEDLLKDFSLAQAEALVTTLQLEHGMALRR